MPVGHGAAAASQGLTEHGIGNVGSHPDRPGMSVETASAPSGWGLDSALSHPYPIHNKALARTRSHDAEGLALLTGRAAAVRSSES